MTTLLSARDLTKHYDGVAALDGVDLDIESGQIMGMIGPNGSGKSTCVGCLTGFVRPTSGTVLWKGSAVDPRRAHRLPRSGLARTFQERMVFDDMPVRDNLRFAALRLGTSDAERRIADMLALVGLDHIRMDTMAKDLSWGQTRLVGMAMALLQEPEVLLLDEPFAGVNRVAAQDINTALLRLRSEGLAMVIIEHEMSLLLPLCDTVVVLAEGLKIAQDHPDAVLKRADVREAYFGITTGGLGHDAGA